MKVVSFLVAALVVSGIPLASAADDDEAGTGIETRTAWTTSRVRGTPEPPPPYRTVPAFPNLRFEHPLLLTNAPGTDRLFVGEQPGRIASFANQRDVAETAPFVDLKAAWKQKKLTAHEDAAGVGAVYGLAFHPDFPQTPLCYICYTLLARERGQHLENGTRVSSFRVDTTETPRCLPETETILLEWLEGGHNGGCLKFGPDGLLYVSAGDAAPPNPPDPFHAGQDVSSVLSTVMRIDIDRTEGERPYGIPPDNPFVDQPDARPEIWSYGFRNPWKMSFDSLTGDLWVGDVGWELYEMVYRVERGGNYGWSIMEGPQPVRPEGEHGPTTILPPTIELPHSVAASVTGGFVYRGSRLPKLRSAYIFGDYETRRVWAAWPNGEQMRLEELLPPTVRLVAFGSDTTGELYLVDYDAGTLHMIEANDAVRADTSFPTRLTETGLYEITADHTLAPGVIPFSVNAPQWQDGARAERFIGVPGKGTIEVLNRERRRPGSSIRYLLDFPVDSVLGKTLSVRTDQGWRRVETQLLHFDGRTWHGYAYEWSDDQQDAVLVPAEGRDKQLAWSPAEGRPIEERTWRLSPRNECIRCHNPWVRNTLAFDLRQLNRSHDYPGGSANQLRTFAHVQLLGGALPELVSVEQTKDARAVPFIPPDDNSAEIADRARSYLAANCAHCHQNGAGGTTTIDLRMALDLEATKTLGLRPSQGTFGIHQAAIVEPGDPYSSVLFYRMAKLGRGRMPHVGSESIDPLGLRLVHDWIQQMPPRDGAGESTDRHDNKATLATTEGALRLAWQLEQGSNEQSTRRALIDQAVQHASPEVRDLFERFLPPSARTKRLGTDIEPAQILTLSGDPTLGRRLFFGGEPGDAAIETSRCLNCHAVGGTGKSLGPALDDVGKRLSRTELLESLIHPSKRIDPRYALLLVETVQGRVFTGLLVERTKEHVVLRDAEDKQRTFRVEDIEEIVPQHKSLMPDLLLRDMTAQQAAHLLAFLESLHGPAKANNKR